LEPEKITNFIVTAILIVGLSLVCIGFVLWIFERFEEFYIDWKIELAALGLILLVFGGIATKLFSRE